MHEGVFHLSPEQSHRRGWPTWLPLTRYEGRDCPCWRSMGRCSHCSSQYTTLGYLLKVAIKQVETSGSLLLICPAPPQAPWDTSCRNSIEQISWMRATSWSVSPHMPIIVSKIPQSHTESFLAINKARTSSATQPTILDEGLDCTGIYPCHIPGCLVRQ